jgi:hypothetical protein
MGELDDQLVHNQAVAYLRENVLPKPGALDARVSQLLYKYATVSPEGERSDDYQEVVALSVLLQERAYNDRMASDDYGKRVEPVEG